MIVESVTASAICMTTLIEDRHSAGSIEDGLPAENLPSRPRANGRGAAVVGSRENCNGGSTNYASDNYAPERRVPTVAL